MRRLVLVPVAGLVFLQRVRRRSLHDWLPVVDPLEVDVFERLVQLRQRQEVPLPVVVALLSRVCVRYARRGERLTATPSAAAPSRLRPRD